MTRDLHDIACYTNIVALLVLVTQQQRQLKATSSKLFRLMLLLKVRELVALRSSVLTSEV